MCLLLIFALCLFNVVLSVDLDPYYSEDVTLSLSRSPYYVISDIIIADNATLTIPNGVEIIFNANYNIKVKGSINAGCVDINTSDIHIRGLVSPQNVHIHSKNNDRSGNINFDAFTDSNGTFCNVLFEGLYYALNDGGPSRDNALIFDNCEFSNMWTVTSFDDDTDSYYATFTDCYFHNMAYVVYSDYVIFNNCLFEDFVNGITSDYVRTNVNIYNSDIIGDGTQTCLRLGAQGLLQNSTIINCDIAVRPLFFMDVLLKYNTFQGNNVAIYLSNSYFVDLKIQYNNFINNNVNIESYSYQDCIDCNYNYFGVSSSNPSAIAATIYDACSVNVLGYRPGIVWFDPWYLNAINFDNLTSLPSEATLLSSFECIGFDTDPSIIGTKLNRIYLPNTSTTLNISHSPYYIKADVEIREGAVLNIPNGVEIIFVNDFEIHIQKGTVNFGCQYIDTSNIHQRGPNPVQKIYIHSIRDYYNDGRIVSDSDITEFCNILFERLDSVAVGNILTFDHCEFNHVSKVNGDTFSNCHFHNYDIDYNDGATFNNCLFENFTRSATFIGSTSIYNSDIIGDGRNGTQTCLQLRSSVLENSTITNCAVSLLSTGNNVIRYNTFENNTVSVHANAGYWTYVDSIQFNNFINNNINIQLEGAADCNDCNYNYLGAVSSNEIAIAMTIHDICDGYSSVLVTWFPWYLNVIDFHNLSNLPTEASLSSLNCVGIDNYPSIIGNKLNAVYLANTTTTLNATDSPYYVKSNVEIQKGAMLRIPDGVEIIFVDDFYIEVKGKINMGCYSINTSSSSNRGLYSSNNKVYIHHISNNRTGGIKFVGSNGDFCNVLFEALDIALSYDNSYPDTILTFDHCEFVNINTVTLANDMLQRFEFRNCYFHHVNLANQGGTAIINNCLFEDFQTSVTAWKYYARSEIYNSDIIGDGIQQCLHLRGDGCYQSSVLENSTLTNCGVAVNTHDYGEIIRYNTFENNIVAVNAQLYRSNICGQSRIQYNNFLYNDVNIELGSGDCVNCTYNYFSISITNQSAIAGTIHDICDGYSNYLVVFWPWLINPYSNMNDTDNIRSFDFIDCNSFNSGTSYPVILTVAPTTNEPTTSIPTTTTATPTTATPTTATPTTAMPTTAIPTTAIPTTAMPTTATPTTATPTTAIPTTAIPTTARPTTARPTTATPTTATPTTSMPTTAMPTAPTTAMPTTATPTTSMPTTAMPTAPTTAMPTSPTTAMPTTTMPTTAMPTTAIPTAPTTANPTTAMPTTAMPTTAIPTAPTTAMPTTATPTTAMPTTGDIGTGSANMSYIKSVLILSFIVLLMS